MHSEVGTCAEPGTLHLDDGPPVIGAPSPASQEAGKSPASSYQTASQPDLPFLDFPREIRDMVYHELWTRTPHIAVPYSSAEIPNDTDMYLARNEGPLADICTPATTYEDGYKTVYEFGYDGGESETETEYIWGENRNLWDQRDYLEGLPQSCERSRHVHDSPIGFVEARYDDRVQPAQLDYLLPSWLLACKTMFGEGIEQFHRKAHWVSGAVDPVGLKWRHGRCGYRPTIAMLRTHSPALDMTLAQKLLFKGRGLQVHAKWVDVRPPASGQKMRISVFQMNPWSDRELVMLLVNMPNLKHLCVRLGLWRFNRDRSGNAMMGEWRTIDFSRAALDLSRLENVGLKLERLDVNIDRGVERLISRDEHRGLHGAFVSEVARVGALVIGGSGKLHVASREYEYYTLVGFEEIDGFQNPVYHERKGWRWECTRLPL